MVVVDCFKFYNELQMLQFRLAELNDVVDHFVLVESTRTHNGNEKKLYFQENKHLFEKYHDKIVHVIVEDAPTQETVLERGPAWANERFQRECIERGVQQLDLSDEDILIIADCDEIPDPKVLSKIRAGELIIDKVTVLVLDLYNYNFRTKSKTKWDKQTKVLNYGTYKKNRSPKRIRTGLAEHKIEPGGWHLSYFGGVDFIVNKIKNFAHVEFNGEKYHNKNNIIASIKSQRDLFNRDNHSFIEVDIESNDYLPKNYRMLL